MAVVDDALHGIVFDALVHVALGVDENLFLVLLVLDANFVEPFAAFGAVGFQRALGHLGGQIIGHFLLLVEHAAGDEGTIRVALQELDHHFLTDAGYVNGAPFLAGPGLRHADEAGGVFVGLAVTIPAELDLDAAVFVGVDFFAGRANDRGGLGALNERLGGDARRPEGSGGGNGAEIAGIERRGAAAGGELATVRSELQFSDEIFAVLGVLRMLLKFED